MSEFRIRSFVLGDVGTNCYLIYNEKTKKGVFVDPADDAPYLLEQCQELGVTPEAILLTHGHFDHILAIPALKRALQLPVYAGEKEEKLMLDPAWNLASSFGLGALSVRPDKLLRDGDELELLGFHWKVLETPGHTQGSLCYYLAQEGVLLSGDTLFWQSYGRTDFPGGSGRQIAESINGKLFLLPDDTMVYPGHGEPTTIGAEKRSNPIIVYR